MWWYLTFFFQHGQQQQQQQQQVHRNSQEEKEKEEKEKEAERDEEKNEAEEKEDGMKCVTLLSHQWSRIHLNKWEESSAGKMCAAVSQLSGFSGHLWFAACGWEHVWI